MNSIALRLFIAVRVSSASANDLGCVKTHRTSKLFFELDLESLGFGGTKPAQTGRPSYHPSVLLKIYIYGYLNRVQSSRRLEREAQRNIEVMWLTSRPTPDFKTIADFRKNSGPAIGKVCRQFFLMCRNLDLFPNTDIAIDGSKFKAVNNVYWIP